MFAFGLSKPVVGEACVTIEKPVERVYRYVAEDFFSNYQNWALEVTEFSPINNNPMAVGALAKQTRIDQGQKVESVFEITVMTKNECLELTGLSAPYRNTYIFKAMNNNQCELTFRFEITQIEIFMRPFEKLLRCAIDEGAETTVKNIRNLISGVADSIPGEDADNVCPAL